MSSTRSNQRKTPPSSRPLRFLSPLHRANRQAAIYMDDELDDIGLSAPEAHVLAYTHAYGPCPIRELVRVFGFRKPTMTSMLDRLEARGLLARTPNPEDRRSFLVSTTGRGRRRAQVARRRVEAFDDAIGRQVTAADRAGFERVLRAIGELTEVDVRGGGI